MKPLVHIKKFRDRYHGLLGDPQSGQRYIGKPNWIRAEFVEESSIEVYHLVFDFKNDEARRAFGALCHVLYTSCENWTITTKRAQE